jgi:hypothetical protein
MLAISDKADRELMVPKKLIAELCATLTAVGTPTTLAQGLFAPNEENTPCAQFSNPPL